jgi:hypothetical protein
MLPCWGERSKKSRKSDQNPPQDFQNAGKDRLDLDVLHRTHMFWGEVEKRHITEVGVGVIDFLFRTRARERRITLEAASNL